MKTTSPDLERERNALLKKADGMLSDELMRAVALAQKIAKKPVPEVKEERVSTGTWLNS